MKRFPLLVMLSIGCALAWPACNRKHDGDAFLPSAPEFADALVLSARDTTLPADGFSRTELTARITGEADLDRRQVQFTTDNGDFPPPVAPPNPPTTTSKTITADVDSNGAVTVELRSSISPTLATITARVLDKTTGAAIEGLITRMTLEFTPAESSSIIQLSASSLLSDADGATTIFIHADIAPELPLPNSVEFATTLGEFISGTVSTDKKMTTVAPDIGRRATAALKSPATAGEALITAKVATPATTEEIRVTFDPALPEVIVVNLSKTKLDRSAMGSDEADIALLLTRAEGMVSSNLAVSYSAFEKGTNNPLELLFREQTLTTSATPATASAKVALGTVGFEGTATIRAAVGSVFGQADIEIDAPLPQPDIEVTPENLAFGSVVVGTTKTLNLIIKNVGLEPLIVSNITVFGGEFSLPNVPALPFVLQPEGTKSLGVIFSPTVIGPQSGTLRINSNDPQEGELVISLTGEGLPV